MEGRQEDGGSQGRRVQLLTRWRSSLSEGLPSHSGVSCRFLAQKLDEKVEGHVVRSAWPLGAHRVLHLALQ